MSRREADCGLPAGAVHELNVVPELQNWITLASMPNQGEFFDHMDRLAAQLRYDETYEGYEL